MGSAAVGAWIAHLAFWILLVAGVASGGLGRRGLALVLALWLAGCAALPFLPYGAALLPSFVAVLDIALVLVIFEGDVHIR